MSKFIVITKKDIIIAIIYILLLSIFIYMLSFLFLKEQTTFNLFIQDHHKDIIRDLDGDGNLDRLYITSNENFYNVIIKTEYGEFPLISALSHKNLIDSSKVNDIKFDFIDLSRDGIPEIIITGNYKAKPITYVFQWSINSFEESFYTFKNIFGILDSKNSKSPRLLYAESNKGDNSTEGFIYNNSTLKNISFSKPKIPSFSAIQKFIDLVELTYELTETPGIFTAYIPSTELGTLWNLDKKIYRYSFQNGYFKDIEWNMNGSPSAILWVLSFEKVNTSDSNYPPEQFILYVKVSLDEFSEYKISSIKR